MVNSSAFQNIPIPVGCLQDERLDGALSSSLTPSFPLTSSLRAIRRGEDLTLPTHLSRAVEQSRRLLKAVGRLLWPSVELDRAFSLKHCSPHVLQHGIRPTRGKEQRLKCRFPTPQISHSPPEGCETALPHTGTTRPRTASLASHFSPLISTLVFLQISFPAPSLAQKAPTSLLLLRPKENSRGCK